MPFTSTNRRLLRGQLSPLVLLAALFSACGGAPDDSRLNVLLVMMDTTRADALGCYGNPRGLTPRIDALAAEGARFERASAHAPWTLPSTASLLTSLLPRQHGAGGFMDISAIAEGRAPKVSFRGLAEEAHTVAEVFRDFGWSTAAVVNVAFLDQNFGLTQGFEHVDAKWFETNTEVRSAEDTTDAALRWLEEDGEGPFFLFVHYFDSHAVYDPPPEYRRRFAEERDREQVSFVFGTRQHMMMLRAGTLELEPELIGRARRLHEGEVAYVDAEVGRLVDGLGGLGLEENTLVVVTADHGEEFLDHGGFEHGHVLYEELTHVPLIFRLPGLVPPGRVVSGTTGLVDVAPTLCELAGIPAPESFIGRSLAEALQGREQRSRPLLAHGNFWGPPLTSWRSGDWKLILTPPPPAASDGRDSAELYNLATDPREEHDLAAELPEKVAELRAELEALRLHLDARARGVPVKLSLEMQRKLEALGYGGAIEESPGSEEPR